MDLNQILISKIKEFFPNGKEMNGEWFCLNPLRHDKNIGSFSINLSSGLYKDFADKSQGNMITLMSEMKGITSKQLWQEYCGKRFKENNFRHIQYGQPKVIYPYYSKDGVIVGYICRFETKDGKVIRPYSNYKWGNSGFPKPYPLYNIHKLNESKKVLVVEGEKAADKAQVLLGNEFLVTTWPFGAKSIEKADWSMLSQCDEIFFWPDNDPAGEETVFSLKAILGKRLHVVNLKALNLTEESWDLGDVDETWTKERIVEILNSSLIEQNDLIIDKIEEEYSKTDEFFLDNKDNIKVISSDYETHCVLENHVNFVTNIQSLNENNNLSVFMDSDETIIGNSVSSIMLFAIDYFKASHDEHAANKIFLKVNDKKLLLREKRKVKNKDKFKVIFKPLDFYDNHFSKYCEYYNQLILNYEHNLIKKKLQYNGTSFEKCKNIIKTFIKYCLVEPNEAEVCAISLIHFILQIKLKLENRHEEILYHSMPVFLNTNQGAGKSDFVRSLCKSLGDFFGEMSIEQITDERHWHSMVKKSVIFCDDFHKINGKSLDMFKSMTSSHHLYARFLGKNKVAKLRQNCTYICTAQTDNLGEKIEDETGNRRFVPFLINTFVDRVFLNDEDIHILKPLYKCENPASVYPFFPVNQADLNYLWQCVSEDWIKEPWYLSELEKLKTVQKKHETINSVEKFFDLFEIEKSEKWIPAAMVYSIYSREFKNAASIAKFTKIIKEKFGEDSAKHRRFKNKIQRAYQIQYNTALEEKILKEFRISEETFQ